MLRFIRFINSIGILCRLFLGKLNSRFELLIGRHSILGWIMMLLLLLRNGLPLLPQILLRNHVGGLKTQNIAFFANIFTQQIVRSLLALRLLLFGGFVLLKLLKWIALFICEWVFLRFIRKLFVLKRLRLFRNRFSFFINVPIHLFVVFLNIAGEPQVFYYFVRNLPVSGFVVPYRN